MAIEYSSTKEISKSPKEVFAFLDHLENAPKWLSFCKSLKNLSGGANKTGDKLEYIYDQGGHIAQMEGVIAAHEAHSHIKLEMVDKMFQVVVKFDLEPSGDGTKFTFTSSIKPLSFMAKILLPVVKATMPSQVKGDAEKLANLIEST
ncbi:MAG: Uncharacterized protein FD163_789 [Hyphomonadaceae bacterium]|nr:MAG: Uncharacterized protein FD128_1451 [Hyphomonadaceae bacterium]KAF0186121.1 MAG: Uncharacterized protein FD163_789 [Hyphomonadaceae bacterium]